MCSGACAAPITWADVAVEPDGTGRLTIARSKTDQQAEGAVQFLEAIRPEDAQLSDSLIGLSARQLARRIKAVCHAAGLPGTFGGHSARVGLARTFQPPGPSFLS